MELVYSAVLRSFNKYANYKKPQNLELRPSITENSTVWSAACKNSFFPSQIFSPKQLLSPHSLVHSKLDSTRHEIVVLTGEFLTLASHSSPWQEGREPPYGSFSALSTCLPGFYWLLSLFFSLLSPSDSPNESPPGTGAGRVCKLAQM